ncbi:NrfD/PsrC family molybdoenzyme membrane anchor subunit [Bacillaceae bacterium S4-13-58]
MNNLNYKVWLGSVSLLSIAAFGTWFYQINQGLIVTGMDNITSWGLYIISFMFLVGLSAGGLIVSSSATVFNIPSFKKVSKPAILLSTVCIILAALLILVDLGSPQRFLNLLIYGRIGSPLIWDVIVITIYLSISLIYLFLITRPKPNEKLLKIMSFVALPVAVLVHSVTAWIFGLQIAQPTWNSALMAPLFVASALDSGLALLLVVLIAMNKFTKFKTDKGLIATLGGLLAVFISVDIFMVLSETLTMSFPRQAEEMEYVHLLLTGRLAPFFWGQLLLGGLIPFLILAFKRNRQRSGLIVLASILVVIGVFFKRVWLLLSSLSLPLIHGAPGVTLGRWEDPSLSGVGPDIWAMIGNYSPTWAEITIFVGMLGFGGLLFTLGYNYLIAGHRHQKTKDSKQPIDEGLNVS